MNAYTYVRGLINVTKEENDIEHIRLKLNRLHLKKEQGKTINEKEYQLDYQKIMKFEDKQKMEKKKIMLLLKGLNKNSFGICLKCKMKIEDYKLYFDKRANLCLGCENK